MDGDGRFFAWVRTVSPWTVPKPSPQIIHDAGMASYKQTEFVGPIYPLKPEQYGLTIDALAELYPAPQLQQD